MNLCCILRKLSSVLTRCTNKFIRSGFSAYVLEHIIEQLSRVVQFQFHLMQAYLACNCSTAPRKTKMNYFVRKLKCAVQKNGINGELIAQRSFILAMCIK